VRLSFASRLFCSFDLRFLLSDFYANLTRKNVCLCTLFPRNAPLLAENGDKKKMKLSFLSQWASREPYSFDNFTQTRAKVFKVCVSARDTRDISTREARKHPEEKNKESAKLQTKKKLLLISLFF